MTSAAILLFIHYGLISLICVYGAHRIYHAFVASRDSQKPPDLKTKPVFDPSYQPKVTVQAPIYNEPLVVARLIDALAGLNWPRDKLQIQIVDDSDPPHQAMAGSLIEQWQRRGVPVEHVYRDSRTGFKAGALRHAMTHASGDIIAIFDSDFLPDPDFLIKTVPHFADPAVGMVQTRWSHLNVQSNWLTRIQGIIIDAHFAIEQRARAAMGAFFNFNGTAGLWRAAAIADAGGWRSATITEDLDLSYRAQLCGWKFLYLPDVECFSELPPNMAAFKVQQHRWAKGAVEVLRLQIRNILRSKLTLRKKVEAGFHLSGNFPYLLILIDAVFFLIPSVLIRSGMEISLLTWLDIPIFFLASVSHGIFFISSQNILRQGTWRHFPMLLPLMATSIGLCVNNGRAVVEALLGWRSGFQRTPKFGDLGGEDRRLNGESRALVQERRDHVWKSGIVETVLGLVYFAGFCWALVGGNWLALPFLVMFCAGFFLVGAPLKLTGARARVSLLNAPS